MNKCVKSIGTDRIPPKEKDIDIYGLDRQPTEWFVRFHVHNGKIEAEQLKSQFLQDHEIVNRLREQLNILEIRFKQAYFPSKRRGKAYRRIKWIKKILGELELQKIMDRLK